VSEETPSGRDQDQDEGVPSWPAPTVRQLLRQLLRAFSSRHLQCQQARFVVMELPVIAENARRLLPLGLFLSRSPRATLFLVDYTNPTFSIPYLEAGLLLHVRTPIGSGVHCPWIVVNEDTPLIYGWQTLAYPKKLAELSLEEDGNILHAHCRRRGVEILRLEARRGEPLAEPGPVFDQRTFNVGGVMQMLGLQPVWASRLRETPTQAHQLSVDLEIQDSQWDAIARLVRPEPVEAYSLVEDIAGARYLLPVGLAGPRWLANNFNLRLQ